MLTGERVEIHAIIRLTTSFGGVLGTIARVEQYILVSLNVIAIVKPMIS